MWTGTSVQLESPVPAAVCPGLTATCAAASPASVQSILCRVSAQTRRAGKQERAEEGGGLL